MFTPLAPRDRTAGASPLLLGAFIVLVVVSVAAAFAGRDWWITTAVVATIIGIVGPLGLLQARREVVALSLDVRRDAVVLERGNGDPIVVRRDAPGFAAAFGVVQRGTATASYERTVIVTDGRQTIRLVDVAWGADTLRRIASALDVPVSDAYVTRAELKRSVGLEPAWWEG